MAIRLVFEATVSPEKKKKKLSEKKKSVVYYLYQY